MKRTFKTIGVYMVLIVLVLFLMVNTINNKDLKMSYSDMIKAIDTNQVESIEYSSETAKAIVKLKEKDGEIRKEVNIPNTQVFVEYVQNAQNLGSTLTFTEVGPSMLTTFIKYISPIGIIIILILFWVFILQQQNGGKAMSFGKSRARLQTNEENKITFKNVAGIIFKRSR